MILGTHICIMYLTQNTCEIWRRWQSKSEMNSRTFAMWVEVCISCQTNDCSIDSNATIVYVWESSTLCTSSYRCDLWQRIYNLSLSFSYYKGCTTTNSCSTAPATQLPINCNLKWYGPPLLLLWYTKQWKRLSLLTGQLANVHWFDVIVEFAQHLLKPHSLTATHK